MWEYRLPCGHTTGHGESCVMGSLCGACSEILKLREQIRVLTRENIELTHECQDLSTAAITARAGNDYGDSFY